MNAISSSIRTSQVLTRDPRASFSRTISIKIEIVLTEFVFFLYVFRFFFFLVRAICTCLLSPFLDNRKVFRLLVCMCGV